MNGVALVRIAKVVALVGFALPWLIVSCSNQTIITASGLDLALGGLAFHNPVNGQVELHAVQPNVLILLAIAAGIAGLVVSFVGGANRMRGLAIVAAAGLILGWNGVKTAQSQIVHEISSEAARRRPDVSLEGQISFRKGLGLAISELGFAAALTVSLLARRGRPDSAGADGSVAASDGAPTSSAAAPASAPAEAEQKQAD
jgi:hypothetical protein